MGITTSDRVLGVLGLFTLEQPEWTVESAAGHMGLPVSTAYRYFRSLSKAGLLVAHATGRYGLGPAIIQYDRQIRLHDPLIMAAQPVMKRLAEALPPHTVTLLCRLFRNQVVCVHQESIERADYAVSYERGRPMPLFRGAASKIILAHMPLRTVRALYEEQAAKFAQAALGKNWDEVKEKLRALRTAELSVTYGELDPGMCGIAVSVFETAGAVVGSLGVVIPIRDLTPERLSQISTALLDAAREVSWTLSLRAKGESSAQPRDDIPPARVAEKKTQAKSPTKRRKPVRQERKRARAQS